MLVLSRKSGERIQIGDNITVEVRRIAGNRVTLALRAPREIRILRGELEQPAKEFRDHEPAAEADPCRPLLLTPHRSEDAEGLPMQQSRDYVI